MQLHDITDYRVASSCVISRGFRLRSSLEVLMDYTGAPEAVCVAAMERARDRGLIEGRDVRWAWPTRAGDRLAEEGLAVIKAAAAGEIPNVLPFRTRT